MAFILYTHIFRKHPPEVFYEKDVLKNFAKFTGKPCAKSLFLIKLLASGLSFFYSRHIAIAFVNMSCLTCFLVSGSRKAIMQFQIVLGIVSKIRTRRIRKLK